MFAPEVVSSLFISEGKVYRYSRSTNRYVEYGTEMSARDQLTDAVEFKHADTCEADVERAEKRLAEMEEMLAEAVMPPSRATQFRKAAALLVSINGDPFEEFSASELNRLAMVTEENDRLVAKAKGAIANVDELVDLPDATLVKMAQLVVEAVRYDDSGANDSL